MASGWVSAAVGIYSAYQGSKTKGGSGSADALTAQQAEIAADQYEEYKTTYQPLERAMVKDAQNYDTPEAYDKAAAEAQATTSQQIGLAQDRLTRTPGLDPSSAAAQSGQTKLALQGAAQGATAQNGARTNVKNTAWARKMDALGLGKGLVTNASNGLAAASNATLANNAAAAQTAAGTGAMIGGLADAGIKAYQSWNSSTPQFTTTPSSTSSLTPVTNSGYTMPDLSGALSF